MGTLYCHGSGWAQRLRCTNFVSLGCCNKILQTREINGTVPGGSAVKNPPANAGDSGSIPGSVRSPGGGHGNPRLYSCLENPADRGAWQATVHMVTESQTRLKGLSTPTHIACNHLQLQQSPYQSLNYLPYMIHNRKCLLIFMSADEPTGKQRRKQ